MTATYYIGNVPIIDLDRSMATRFDSYYEDNDYSDLHERAIEAIEDAVFNIDACLKPSDKDAAGRLCGKRATSGKQAGKIKPGSPEAKALAQKIRDQEYPSKFSKHGLKATLNKLHPPKPSNGKGSDKRKAAGQKAAKTKARKATEREYLANNPAARKSLERKAAKSGSTALQKKAFQAEQDQYSKKAKQSSRQSSLRRKALGL